MKEYAKQFYESQAWKDCRESFLTSKYYICERCGGIAKIAHHKIYITPANINDLKITLSFNNLEALCQDCHNREHHKKNKAELRYSFDREGNIIKNLKYNIFFILPPFKKIFFGGRTPRGDINFTLQGRA